MLYRILTQDVNRDGIVGYIGTYFDSYTVIPAIGFWHGFEEKSLIIEIDTDNRIIVERIALWIKQTNKQEAVLVQCIDTKSKLV